MRCYFVAIILWAFAVPLLAQDFNTGMAAYKSGDLSTALEEWEPLAEEGNAFAQFNLGIMLTIISVIIKKLSNGTV